jgi:GTP cyclohydrolase II
MDLVSFRSEERQDELVALVKRGRDAAGTLAPLVRVHSACLTAAGIVVEERLPLWRPSNAYNRTYLEVERDYMGHFPTDESADANATRESA